MYVFGFGYAKHKCYVEFFCLTIGSTPWYNFTWFDIELILYIHEYMRSFWNLFRGKIVPLYLSHIQLKKKLAYLPYRPAIVSAFSQHCSHLLSIPARQLHLINTEASIWRSRWHHCPDKDWAVTSVHLVYKCSQRSLTEWRCEHPLQRRETHADRSGVWIYYTTLTTLAALTTLHYTVLTTLTFPALGLYSGQ